jgi:hypothetical protein
MRLRELLLTLAVLALGAVWAEASAAVTASDLAEIRSAINRQLEAAQGDCARVAPARIAFLDLMVMGPDVVQQVKVTDRVGGLWMAYFSMERRGDGSWRTSSCTLVQPAKTISA